MILAFTWVDELDEYVATYLPPLGASPLGECEHLVMLDGCFAIVQER